MDVEDIELTNSVEQLFLSAIERGDVHAVKHALEHRSFSNNALSDASSGQDAMQIALENGHIEIVKVLLHHDVCVKDSLLRAVDLQFYKAVEVICNFSKTLMKRKGLDIINSRSDNEDFHPVMTPVMLAAHHNDYDIIKLLLSYGATLEDPETATVDVTEKRTLQHSVGTLLVYRALASEAFITLTEADPINRAFLLCEKLRKLGEREVEFGDDFTALQKQCEVFAAELLAQARNSDETAAILTYNPKELANTGKVNVDTPHKCFEAVIYQQKKFMAHPYCQQFLIERWYHGLADWRERGMFLKLLLSNVIMLFCPILSLVYILCPHEKIIKFFRIAYVKFLMHTGSSIWFVLLIFISLFRIDDLITRGQSSNPIDPLENAVIRDSTRGRTPTVIEWIMLAWIIGMTWREIKQVWNEGLKKYLTDSWNFMDFLSLALYWMSYTLMLISWLRWRQAYQELAFGGGSTRNKRMVDYDVENPAANNTVQELKQYIDLAVSEILQNTSAIHGGQLRKFAEKIIETMDSLSPDDSSTNDLLSETDTVADILSKFQNENSIVESRLYWNSYDPDLVVEALFSVANILTVLRLINIVVISKQVGPLHVSLWGMFNDIAKFLAIFCFVLMAFTMGITQLYKFYSTLRIIECNKSGGDSSCQRGFTSFTNTLRALFWNLFGYIQLNDLETNANHVLTEGIGEFAFAMYHVLGIIILLNALIAMMSNTYTRIEENSDMEWKFSRAQLWLSYIEKGTTAPPPFNVIPSVKTVWRFLVQLKYILCPSQRKRRSKKRRIEREKIEDNYVTICHQLVVRYWAERRSASKEGEKSVTQADIMRLKQDISSLRYELLSGQRMNERSFVGVVDTTKQTLGKIQDIETALEERPVRERKCVATEANIGDVTETVDVDVHSDDAEGVSEMPTEGATPANQGPEEGPATAVVPLESKVESQVTTEGLLPGNEVGDTAENGLEHESVEDADYVPREDANLTSDSESESESGSDNFYEVSAVRKIDKFKYPIWSSMFK